MPQRVRIKWVDPGFGSILHSGELRSHLEGIVEGIAQRAAASVTSHKDDAYGPPFTAGVDDRGSRLVGYVVTSNFDGIRAEYHGRALSREL